MVSGGNVLLIGPPGSGKTTSLRKLASDLEQRNVPVATVNCSLATSTAELLDLVAEGLSLPLLPNLAAGLQGARHGLRGAMEGLRRLATARPGSCVLLDGDLQTEIAQELFGRLRDEVWELELRWALACRPALAVAMRTPPVDAFWDRAIQIPPLTVAEATELLERGLDDEERWNLPEADLWAPDPLWPRGLVSAVRDQLEGTSLAAPDQLEVLRQKEAELSRAPSMVLAELQQLRRPAAAGDPELVERLGFSRPHISRALAELEQLGLVQASMGSTEGRQGRPVKFYEPTIGRA